MLSKVTVMLTHHTNGFYLFYLLLFLLTKYVKFTFTSILIFQTEHIMTPLMLVVSAFG